MGDCNGSNNQKWYLGSNGQISPMSNRQKCIDLPGNNYQNGNQLHIWDCHELPQQKWGYDGNMGSIYLASSSADATKCIDVSGGGQNNGAPVQIWDCYGSNWNQKFDVCRLELCRVIRHYLFEPWLNKNSAASPDG